MEGTPLENPYVVKIASHKVFSSKLLSPVRMPGYFVKIVNNHIPFRSYSLFLFLKGHCETRITEATSGSKTIVPYAIQSQFNKYTNMSYCTEVHGFLT